MLQLKKLTLTHKKDLRPLVEDLSALIQAGDRLAIIGEEGNGKSALLKVMAGLREVDSYLTVEGELINQFQQVAYLPQDLPAETLATSVYDFIFGDWDLNDLDYGDLARLLGRLSLREDLIYEQRELKTLSGGQKMKVQLLKLLLTKPDLLLLDEPSNDLDLTSLVWLEDFIKTSEQTIVFVSHDVRLLSKTATSILHLESLKHKSQAKATVDRMDYQTYLAIRQSESLKQGQLAQQQQSADHKRMAELSRVKQKLHHKLSQTKDASAGRLLAKKMKSLKSREKRYQRERQDFVTEPIKEDQITISWGIVHPLPASKSVVRLTDYDLMVDGFCLISNINLVLFGQDKIGLVGDNGLGKSLLMKTIWDSIKDRQDLQVNYMPQDYLTKLERWQSPLDYLLELTAWDKGQVMTFLGSMQFLVEEMTRPIAALSGGQRAKLLILGLIASQANFLLLDEPTRNLSPDSVAILTEKLAAFQGGFLVISHDREFLAQTCDKIYELGRQGLREIEEL